MRSHWRHTMTFKVNYVKGVIRLREQTETCGVQKDNFGRIKEERNPPWTKRMAILIDDVTIPGDLNYYSICDILYETPLIDGYKLVLLRNHRNVPIRKPQPHRTLILNPKHPSINKSVRCVKGLGYKISTLHNRSLQFAWHWLVIAPGAKRDFKSRKIIT